MDKWENGKDGKHRYREVENDDQMGYIVLVVLIIVLYIFCR